MIGQRHVAADLASERKHDRRPLDGAPFMRKQQPVQLHHRNAVLQRKIELQDEQIEARPLERDERRFTIGNLDDRCPMDAEDRDGFEDADGCPDPDNDRDGVLDARDSCPNNPEDKDGLEDEDLEDLKTVRDAVDYVCARLAA